MSHPQGFGPDEVKDEDHVDLSNQEEQNDNKCPDCMKVSCSCDSDREQMLENNRINEHRRMEEHFTRETDNFGGSHHI